MSRNRTTPGLGGKALQDAVPTLPALPEDPSAEVSTPVVDDDRDLAPTEPVDGVAPTGATQPPPASETAAPPAVGPVVEASSGGPTPGIADPDLPPPPTEDEYPPDAPNEREPSVPTLAEYVESGYDPSGYHKRFGKNPAPNTARALREAEAVAAALRAPAPPREGRGEYVVWPHGALQRNGKVHAPGSVVNLPHVEAFGIECLSPSEE